MNTFSNFCTSLSVLTILYQCIYLFSSIYSPWTLTEIPNDIFLWRSELALHFRVNPYLASLFMEAIGEKSILQRCPLL